MVKKLLEMHGNVIVENLLLVIGCLVMYSINENILKKVITNNYIQGHLNDCLAGVILVSALRMVLLLVFSKDITFIYFIRIVVFAGFYWEFITPLYLSESVTDYKDLIAYGIGGSICFAINKRCILTRGKGK